ncbi:hypothetical protein D3C73_1198340 [compost metagenome]
MMLGTPASNSTAVPKGRFSQAGQISVRNKAIPKLIGNAISKAMKEVISVPTMAIAAPYLSLTGSHSTLVTNGRPNSFKAGHAPIIRDAMMPSKTNKTLNAKMNVTL